MSDRIRIVLADDHGILRAGLKALLEAEPDMEVVAEAANGLQAVERCVQFDPDVMVLDLNMPGLSGQQALAQIVELKPHCKVLVLTMLTEEYYMLEVLRAGGSGYVPKSAADTELIDAIRTVYRGKVYLRPSEAQMLLSEYLKGETPGQERDALSLLSSREREVLELTARGFSSREIGDRVFISPKTVDTYRQRAMDKLGLGHRSELVAFAIRKGLLRE